MSSLKQFCFLSKHQSLQSYTLCKCHLRAQQMLAVDCYHCANACYTFSGLSRGVFYQTTSFELKVKVVVYVCRLAAFREVCDKSKATWISKGKCHDTTQATFYFHTEAHGNSCEGVRSNSDSEMLLSNASCVYLLVGGYMPLLTPVFCW